MLFNQEKARNINKHTNCMKHHINYLDELSNFFIDRYYFNTSHPSPKHLSRLTLYYMHTFLYEKIKIGLFYNFSSLFAART